MKMLSGIAIVLTLFAQCAFATTKVEPPLRAKSKAEFEQVVTQIRAEMQPNGRFGTLDERARQSVDSGLGEMSALFDKTLARFGRVDVLFNNAGTGAGAPFDLLTLEQWQNVVDTNLTGSFLCAQAAFRAMKAQTPRGGRIINNGSISAHAPRPNSAAYTATKHAMTGITKTLALDMRPHDIAVCQIDIGNAATEMTDRMVQGQGVPQAHGGYMIEPRMDVKHVANAIVYMASLPLDANVLFMTVMATKMPLVGRG